MGKGQRQRSSMERMITGDHTKLQRGDGGGVRTHHTKAVFIPRSYAIHRGSHLVGAAAGRRRRHVCPRVGQLDYDHCHAVSPTPTLYKTVLLVMLMPMDTSTSSKGEGELDFCCSKVSQRPSHGQGGQKPTLPNLVPGCCIPSGSIGFPEAQVM